MSEYRKMLEQAADTHGLLPELLELYDANDRLRAANARLQAWHDAVMGQETHSIAPIPYTYAPGFVPPEHAMTIKTAELIIRPQPLAKE